MMKAIVASAALLGSLLMPSSSIGTYRIPPNHSLKVVCGQGSQMKMTEGISSGWVTCGPIPAKLTAAVTAKPEVIRNPAAGYVICYTDVSFKAYNANFVVVDTLYHDLLSSVGSGGESTYTYFEECENTAGYWGLIANSTDKWVGVNDDLGDDLTATAGGLGGSEEFTLYCRVVVGVETQVWVSYITSAYDYTVFSGNNYINATGQEPDYDEFAEWTGGPC